MAGRKQASPGIDKALRGSVNYEVSLSDLSKRSERRAWFVAGSAVLLALLLAGGYLVMLPLKERVPFLVMADAYTGTATIARLTSGLSGSTVTANQAINRSNIARYVTTRESYDHDLLNARDWRVVFTMSTPEVASTYRARYAGGNPDSPIKLYGKGTSIRVNLISITPTSEGWFGRTGGANVRFQRVKVNKTSGGTEILDTKSATLLYTYNEALPLTEEQRFDNPLGFQVTDYRVVDELISLPVQPPSAVPTATPPVAHAAATQATFPALAPHGQQHAPAPGHDEASASAQQGVAVPPTPGQPASAAAQGTHRASGASNR